VEFLRNLEIRDESDLPDHYRPVCPTQDTVEHLVGKPKGLLPHAVVALPERGAKVRVVTESPAPLVASLHWVRRTCFARLKSLPWTRHVLFGNRREAVEVLFKDEILGKRTLVSADLTAATDRIPHSHA